MNMVKGTTVRARQSEMLDALANRRLGSTVGHVEATLDANPQLSKLGPHLPLGQPVRLVRAVAPTKETVNLWD